ncbi:sensory rhodopsin transducer [Azoarcus sp. PA01]|nr:sensory rhodopsin transducer [Azoarcus sp. PA01]
MDPIGKRRWAIAEGYIPPSSTDDSYELKSHEAACILNAGDRPAQVEITIFFADREPAGPYLLTVPARRTCHLRFDELDHPEPIPVNTPYSSVIESTEPVVVQHTRLDSRKAALALLTTIAYADQ